MKLETLISIADSGILICWVLLVVAPRWRATRFAVHSIAVPLILGAVYIWLIGRVWLTGGSPGASYTTLPGIAKWYGSEAGVAIMWIHYLVFGLFIGAWEARDAARRGISHWLVVPSLIATMIAGPLGLLLYLATRLVLRRGGWPLAEAHA